MSGSKEINPTKMSLKTDKTKEQKWLMSAKKNNPKRDMKTSQLKHKKNTKKQEEDLAEQRTKTTGNGKKKTREGACPTAIRTKCTNCHRELDQLLPPPEGG
jgi:hypothetical protein